MKRLLVETIRTGIQILETAKPTNGNQMKIGGIVAGMDEINENGRVYREFIMDREAGKLKPLMEQNRVFLEADHPPDGKSTIGNTVALLTKLEKQTIDTRKVYWGEATVLNTAKGKDLQEIIRAGGKVGFSQRGWGDLQEGTFNGQKADIIQEDYSLKTFDIVVGQSTAGAEVQQISEQLDLVRPSINGKLLEEISDVKARLKESIDLRISLHFKKRGKLPTEKELQEITKEFHNEYFFRKILICEALTRQHPRAEFVSYDGKEIVYFCEDGVKVLKAKIEGFNDSRELLLGEATDTGRRIQSNELNEAQLYQRRMAGLPSLHKMTYIDESKLTPDQKRDRAMIGLSVESFKPSSSGKSQLTDEQKRDRATAGLPLID